MDLLKFTIGVIMLMVMMISCGNNNQTANHETTAQEYPVMVVKKQDANMQSVYPATIRGQEDIEIKPRVDGYIDAIYVDEGSVVRAGQALFKINSPSSEQALTSARAAVNSEMARVNTAKVDVERYRPLAEKGIVSEVQLQTYENAYKTAQAVLEQAEATLKNAQATMSWTTVTSPVDGVVGSIPYRKGSLVNSSSTLTSIANTGSVYAYFSLNERKLMDFLDGVEGTTQYEKIKNMPPVTLILSDGSIYEDRGRIETITGTVDITTGSANFRAEFPNKSGKLRSGTSGKIVIPKTLSEVFVIPQHATFNQQDKVLVYKMEGDSIKQHLISVQSMPNGLDYAVTKGLSDGDKIVSDGVATLRNGMKIAVKRELTASN
ncbi:membrane fusion protein (multidrug efflux system) [Parabacteroides sp. PF5-5]|uniref:efflux RND transporter periplasmic adaptor subunit n=1 Tax=unclassified Parabacteroides TaxID=2649774 RepID=UPI002475567B|nr:MULTISPECIES: efflux RND transporter periplasmic adaptor subunit [unclassified Parabacteroides]MDH6304741.1 membrane fusion protein (multidrug efflux system) [Parabacteroides sp. PH5-39]MDH6315644.1 membrane fusion protein (multidrug efflux system) [Parabacteroides sp. PF5-13]MDH6319305.1 membrane fusion protein (multidrug efflux system) [Parabacteroides sp. PH5-13]MDH6323036.1 membrane fusion protein (multidrug efflux system) [Parabacteroides sp. PH5-8]MDH6326837.1 membrane fusion protein 